MIEQRGTRCRPITEMYVDSLKGLKKRGTRGEGRQRSQGKIGQLLTSQSQNFPNFVIIVVRMVKSAYDTIGAADQYSLLKADGVESVIPNIE